jgi:hypothetical protein
MLSVKCEPLKKILKISGKKHTYEQLKADWNLSFQNIVFSLAF